MLVVGNGARQNIPLRSWCHSKPSLPGLIHPSFYPRTGEIEPHFLPPFNSTLTKITSRLRKFIFAALPLRNFAIKIEFALIFCLIKTLFAEFVFISQWLIVNLIFPFLPDKLTEAAASHPNLFWAESLTHGDLRGSRNLM